MKKYLLLCAIALLFLVSPMLVSADDLIFSDVFDNRSGAVVGNGWIEGGDAGFSSIDGDRYTCLDNSGANFCEITHIANFSNEDTIRIEWVFNSTFPTSSDITGLNPTASGVADRLLLIGTATNGSIRYSNDTGLLFSPAIVSGTEYDINVTIYHSNNTYDIVWDTLFTVEGLGLWTDDTGGMDNIQFQSGTSSIINAQINSIFIYNVTTNAFSVNTVDIVSNNSVVGLCVNASNSSDTVIKCDPSSSIILFNETDILLDSLYNFSSYNLTGFLNSSIVEVNASSSGSLSLDTYPDTFVIRANNTANDSLIDGLCGSITNGSFSGSSCNTSGTDVIIPLTSIGFLESLYTVSVSSVGVGDGSAGSFTNNQTIEFNVSSSNSVTILSTPISLFLEFRDEENRSILSGTNVSISVIDSAGGISDFSTSDGNITLSGNFVPGEYTVRYTAQGYGLRDFFFNFTGSNPTNAETLYLLLESTYTPGTVEVRDFDGTPVSNATVLMERYYGESSIPNDVQYGRTNDDGEVVFVAESVTAFYTFSVTIDNVVRFIDANPELLVVGSDGLWHKVITLDLIDDEYNNPTTGFSYTFIPQGGLFNNTLQDFNFSIDSTIWDMTSCNAQLLRASDSVVLGSNTSFCSANTGAASITYNVTTTDSLLFRVTVSTSEFSNVYQEYYTVIPRGNNTFTLQDLVDDLSSFSGSGFNDFGRFFIAIIVIIGATISLAGVTNWLREPEEMLGLMTAISIFFSFIGWLDINIPGIPVAGLGSWIITIILGLFTLVSVFRKIGVTR